MNAHTPPPSARMLAQIRAAVTAKGLSAEVADLLAEQPEMSITRVEALLPGLSVIETYNPLKAEVRADARKRFLTATAGTPGDVNRAAYDAICDALADEQHRTDPSPRPGAPAARVGSDWTAGPGLRQKQSDAIATLVAAELGLRHEPTAGREFIAEDAAATKLRMAYHVAGQRGERPGSDAEALQVLMATTSTSDYPLIAAGSVEVVVARALEQAPIGLRQVTHVISATDWRARNHVGLSGANVMETVNEGGEAKFVTINEEGEALPAPARKAGFFRATDELLRNAGRSVELEVALGRAMIEGANETLRGVIADKITTPGNLADGVAVFATERKNVNATASAISVANISIARTGLARQVDSEGTRRPVDPSILLVAPEDQTLAEQVVTQITAAEVAQVNPFAGRLRVIADPGLPATGTDHWYLLGDPTRFDGLALIMLDDMMAPEIEARPAWPGFGWEWRAQWPMAAAWVRPSWFRTRRA